MTTLLAKTRIICMFILVLIWLLIHIHSFTLLTMLIVYNFVAKLATFFSYPTPSLNPRCKPSRDCFQDGFPVPYPGSDTVASTHPHTTPTIQFNSSVVFEVLHVTAHHAKFLRKL